MSINVSSLEPIIIEPERSIRCDLLCKLRCTYSKGDITYVYNKKGNLYFKYEGNGSMDVYFNNSAYKLDRIYIGERRHKTYPNDPSIIGECTLIHKGRDNNLIICLLLRASRGFCDSQDFFSQFLNVQVGQFNENKKIKIRTSDEWSAQQALPSNTSYYIYNDKKNKTIVFQHPVDIDPDNYKKVENLLGPIKEERALGSNEYLYYHPVVNTTGKAGNKEISKCINKKSYSIDLDPHKSCDNDKEIFDDNPPEYDGIEGYETVFGTTIVSLILLVVSLCIFKLIPRTPINFVRDIYKIIGFFIWFPIHFSYIWFGQLSTISIFFCIFLLGYMHERYLMLKKQVSKLSENDENNGNKPVNVGESKVIAVNDVGLNDNNETNAPQSAVNRVNMQNKVIKDNDNNDNIENAPQSAVNRVNKSVELNKNKDNSPKSPPEWTDPKSGTKNPIHNNKNKNVFVGGGKPEDMFDWASISGIDKYEHLNKSKKSDSSSTSNEPSIDKDSQSKGTPDWFPKENANATDSSSNDSDSVSARWVDSPNSPPPPPPPSNRTIPDSKKNDVSDEDKDEINRNRLCSWIRKYETILDDEDLEEAMNNFVYKDDEEKEEFDNMTRLYNNLKKKGPICSGRSQAWALFMSRIKYGLYTKDYKYYRFTCTFITISFIVLCFIGLFGSPIKFKNTDSEALGYYKFKDDGKICRNRIRTLGNGYPIDTCYRPTDLKDYILDKETRDKFEKTYLRNRRKERSAYDSCVTAFSQIDPRINMKFNWKVEIVNDQNSVISIIEVKACDFYNHFFVEGMDRACATKTIKKKIVKKEEKKKKSIFRNPFGGNKKKKSKKKRKNKKQKKKTKKAFGGKCFAVNTRVLMNNGEVKYIQDINIGDLLYNNNVVEGKMVFSGEDANLVINSGIISTYEHHVLHNNVFKKSGHVPGVKILDKKLDYLYDIDTSNHRIVILNDKDEKITFTDFTEVDDTKGHISEYELNLLNKNHISQPISVN